MVAAYVCVPSRRHQHAWIAGLLASIGYVDHARSRDLDFEHLARPAVAVMVGIVGHKFYGQGSVGGVDRRGKGSADVVPFEVDLLGPGELFRPVIVFGRSCRKASVEVGMLRPQRFGLSTLG